MNTQLFIPTKINVGLQGRDDTYTGKLADIIYWDNKGKLRKEGSWESWRWKEGQKRNERINGEWVDIVLGPEYAPQAFENVPTEGFVLNKDVGGTRRSYGWDARVEKVRVYDPRNFEFEISIPNLLFILQETSAIKGKGLEGEFVYAWNGAELILLPVGCKEYQTSTNFTDLQGKKITRVDMLPGCMYKTKKQVEVMYLGKSDWVDTESYNRDIHIYPAHIFYDVKKNKFYPEKGFTNLGERLTVDVADNYSDIYEEFQKSVYHSKIVSLVSEPFEFNETELIGENNWGHSTYTHISMGGEYIAIRIEPNFKWVGSERKFIDFEVCRNQKVKFVDNKLTSETIRYDYRGGNYTNRYNHSFNELKAFTLVNLYVILDSGEKHEINDYFKRK